MIVTATSMAIRRRRSEARVRSYSSCCAGLGSNRVTGVIARSVTGRGDACVARCWTVISAGRRATQASPLRLWSQAIDQLVARDRRLLALAKVLQHHTIRRQLALADDHAEGGAFALGDLELVLHGPAADIHVGADAGGAELAHELPVEVARRVAVRDEPDERALIGRDRHLLRLERAEQPLDAR